MPETAPNMYDQMPYDTDAHYPSHPSCLATVGRLVGMTPPDVATCRVLELGCGNGGNIISMADSIPNGQFVGVDLSTRQLELGRKTIEAVGLTNVELKHQSIADVDGSFGKFDYIVCHGVYSWVPLEVADSILRICKENLTPQGIAFVSYNVFPGWFQRQPIRDLFNFHTAHHNGTPQDRAVQAKAILKFMVDSTAKAQHICAQTFRKESELLADKSDTYIYHEHLEECNHPIYFYEFAERAQNKGLQYLGDAWTHGVIDDYPPDVRKGLSAIAGDLIRLEQYFDFLRNISFRRTLLCHDDVTLSRRVSPEVIEGFSISAAAEPANAKPDIFSNANETFKAARGKSATTNHPLLKTAFVCLAETWPRQISFEQLWKKVEEKLSVNEAGKSALAANGARNGLASALVRFYLANLVSLDAYVSPHVTELTDRPHGSPLARHQAATTPHVTTRRHRSVNLNPLDQQVLLRADGRNDREAILDSITGLVGDGTLKVEHQGRQVTNPAEAKPLVAQGVDASLQRLLRLSLLVEDA